MSRQIQLRRGTTAQHENFTGAIGEVTFDTDKKTLRVHDGQTIGGIEVGKINEELLNIDKDAIMEYGQPDYFNSIEITNEINATTQNNPYTISKNCILICYSEMTAHLRVFNTNSSFILTKGTISQAQVSKNEKVFKVNGVFDAVHMVPLKGEI